MIHNDLLKEIVETLKKVEKQVNALKKSRDYLSSVSEQVQQTKFEFVDQKAYLNLLRDNAVKKSNLVALLSQEDILTTVREHATSNLKNNLYDLMSSHELVISSTERNALVHQDTPIIPHGFTVTENKFIVNPSYSDEKANYISAMLSPSLKKEGEQHLFVQEQALKTIQIMGSSWDNQQALFQLSHKAFGDHYDDVMQEFKQAAKRKELTAVYNQDNEITGFSLLTKFIGRDQKIQFNIDEHQHINKISFIPELKNTIDSLRQKMNPDVGNKEQFKPT